MADKHPYSSSTGGIKDTVSHLRRSFPAEISSETLKKLGIAPNNESYIINILRFLKIIDAQGKKVGAAATVFNKHSNDDFEKAFADMVKSAYADLFSLHGDGAWNLPADKLISYFRNTDQSTAIVGQRQSQAFQTLAALAGKRQASVAQPAPKQTGQNKPRAPSAPKSKPTPAPAPVVVSPSASSRDFGLAVRIEINLPAGGDQETYDKIFKSIRANLLDGK